MRRVECLAREELESGLQGEVVGDELVRHRQLQLRRDRDRRPPLVEGNTLLPSLHDIMKRLKLKQHLKVLVTSKSLQTLPYGVQIDHFIHDRESRTWISDSWSGSTKYCPP